MTGRETLVAASRGQVMEDHASLTFDSSIQADGYLVTDTVGQMSRTPDCAVLGIVQSLSARVLQSLEAMNLIDGDPLDLEFKLDQITQEIRAEAEAHLAQADGIVYFISGANPNSFSPMQYGGLFLERDRAILNEFSQARLNLVYVDDQLEPYLDFVSDLPGHLFAFRSEACSDLKEIKQMRGGPIACNSEDADVYLNLPIAIQQKEKIS